MVAIGMDIKVILLLTVLNWRGASCYSILLGVKDCGLSPPTPRIVNGSLAPNRDYGWMAAITDMTTGEAFCGGSFITRRHIISAAHCSYEGDYEIENFESEILIQFGNVDLLSPDNIWVRPVRVIRHPKYNPKGDINDIMTIDLGKAFLSNSVPPICVPWGVTNEMLAGRTALVAGWGSTYEDGEMTTELRYTSQIIQKDEQCANNYEILREVFDKDTQMCAHLPVGTDSCEGDSGGPLFVTWGRRRYIVGIVSYGDGCARPDSPGVYTKIDKVTDFIVDSIRAMGGSQYIPYAPWYEP